MIKDILKSYPNLFGKEEDDEIEEEEDNQRETPDNNRQTREADNNNQSFASK